MTGAKILPNKVPRYRIILIVLLYHHRRQLEILCRRCQPLHGLVAVKQTIVVFAASEKTKHMVASRSLGFNDLLAFQSVMCCFSFTTVADSIIRTAEKQSDEVVLFRLVVTSKNAEGLQLRFW